MEFECKDIGNQNCGFKAEANTQEELVTKVNQHMRSAHGMNPTDAQDKVERAIKEKEAWRGSSSTNSTGSSFQSGSERQGYSQQGQNQQTDGTGQESRTTQRYGQTSTQPQTGTMETGKYGQQTRESGQDQRSGMTNSTSTEKQYESTKTDQGQRGRGTKLASEKTTDEEDE